MRYQLPSVFDYAEGTTKTLSFSFLNIIINFLNQPQSVKTVLMAKVLSVRAPSDSVLYREEHSGIFGPNITLLVLYLQVGHAFHFRVLSCGLGFHIH